MSNKQQPTSLAHVRVLDLTRVLAGPWCTQNLADLGADVIKVERPGVGDDTRNWGPPYAKNSDGKDSSESAYYLCANRGKRSITVDIASPEGQHIIQALAMQSDVVIENYKVDQLKKYGLDYASLSALKPDLIYCSMTGFGQTGPYAARSGYDFMIQGMGGLMSITGAPECEPQKAGIAIVDLMTGMYATIAVLAALNHRERTGIGQYIDLSLLDVQVAMLANFGSNYLTSGVVPTRRGNEHASIVPYQTFATSDGYIIVNAGNDNQYRQLVEAGGCPELASDPRFATNPQRVAWRATLVPLLAEMIKTKTKAEWLALLEKAGVPCGPINQIDEVFNDAQVAARQCVIELPHPTGQVKLVANPIHMSVTPPSYNTAPPLLGQHTDEVLRELLGYSERQLSELRDKNRI